MVYIFIDSSVKIVDFEQSCRVYNETGDISGFSTRKLIKYSKSWLPFAYLMSDFFFRIAITFLFNPSGFYRVCSILQN